MEARLWHVLSDLSCLTVALTPPLYGAPEGDFENLPVLALRTSMMTSLDSQNSNKVG